MDQEQAQLPPINRFGSCPHCEIGWDGGDILQELKKMDVFKGKTDQEMMQMAAQYGYTESNRIHFSKLEGIELPAYGRAFWRCPKCYHVWDRHNNFHYISINHALNIPDQKPNFNEL